MTALALADRGLPMAKCAACGRAGDIHDLTSLRLTGLCPGCRISEATPTRGLAHVRTGYVTVDLGDGVMADEGVDY
jgi:hypothetical protein